MPTPLYNMLMGNPAPQMRMQNNMQFMNPFQQANYIMQAMQNPPGFVKQQLPDIPDEILNDPNKILGYMQQKYGITNAQIQQVAGMLPFGMR